MKKTVLITGASSGLGRAAARHFATNGWNVVATMRRPEAEQELAGRGEVLVTRLDVQDHASIAQAIAAGIARFGQIDTLLNNAGFGLFGFLDATPPGKARDQFDLSLFGVMDVTRAILPHFRKNKRGTIINISSGAGVFTLPMLLLYCASKIALEGFSESLSYELASQNISVKIVESGGVGRTSFGSRLSEEIAHNTAVSDFDAFAGRNATFAGLKASRSASEENIAQIIFGAATDGTDQLRYVAADDTVPLVKARQETSDQGYPAFTRSSAMLNV